MKKQMQPIALFLILSSLEALTAQVERTQGAVSRLRGSL